VCIKVLSSPSPGSSHVWLDDCRAAFSTLTSDKQSREAAEAAAESAKSYAQPDDLIDFGHLRSRKGGISQLELEDQVCWVGWGGGEKAGEGGLGACGARYVLAPVRLQQVWCSMSDHDRRSVCVMTLRCMRPCQLELEDQGGGWKAVASVQGPCQHNCDYGLYYDTGVLTTCLHACLSQWLSVIGIASSLPATCFSHTTRLLTQQSCPPALPPNTLLCQHTHRL
jgi:hypothetical protein